MGMRVCTCRLAANRMSSLCAHCTAAQFGLSKTLTLPTDRRVRELLHGGPTLAVGKVVGVTDHRVPQLGRNLGKVFAAYRGAVRARMLIPVGLAAAMLAYNTLNPEQPLTLTQEVLSG